MKFIDIIKTANSNLLRNKGRTFLTILAIFIGSFTIIATSAIRTGVNGYIDNQLKAAGGEGYLEIMPAATSEMMNGSMMGGGDVQEYNPEKNSAALTTIKSSDIEKISKIAGVKMAKTLYMPDPEYITTGAKDAKKYVIKAMEFPTESVNIDMASGKNVDTDGKIPEISIPDKYVSVLGFKNNADAVGKKVKIAVMNVLTQKIVEIELTISGVMNPSVVGMGRSWVNTEAGRELYDAQTAGLPAEYKDQAYFAVAQLSDDYLTDEKIDKVKDELKDMGYSAMTTEDEVGMIKTFFDAILLVFTIFGGIALLAASIGIINTLFMSVQERTREIGLMKAMGLGKGKIFLMFSFEAVSLGFWGSAIGVGVVFLARLIINPLAADTFLKGLPGFNLMEFDVSSLVILVALVMAIAFLAGTLPARRAAKKDPIEALRYE
jgi:putative ABC transport system permease protein